LKILRTLSNRNGDIMKIAMNLACACVLSGIIIAVTYYFTNPAVERQSVEMRDLAMKTLTPEADGFQKIDGKPGWFRALKSGKVIAYVVPSESRGYGGLIKLLVAVDREGRVLRYNIFESKETPGMGDKAGQDPFCGQFAGKTIAHLKVVKDPNNKRDIQAISGATITSNAVTDGVRTAVKQILMFLRRGQ
jgi:Na+-translocating ferredoxin:NAD+ oxidoreductase subunit G